MRPIRSFLICLLLTLSACGQVSQAELATATIPAATTPALTSTPPAVTEAVPSSTLPPPRPTVTSAPPTMTIVPPTATPAVPLATLTAELSATVVAALPPTATPDPQNQDALFRGIDSVAVAPLTAPAGSPPLWVVSSQGFPNFDTEKNFVEIYTRTDGNWKELSRLELDGDRVQMDGAQQVQVEPHNIWLEVESGLGAHSGCYDLLRFDGTTLSKEVEGCNSSPFAGELRDLDGDSVPEVVLNNTDNYVFCYACGERNYAYEVYHWDGTHMSPVKLQPVPGDDEASRFTTLAAAQASVGLWKDAQTTISRTLELGNVNQTERLYGGIISLHTQDLASQVADAKYPLLDNLFYGDYPAALGVLRAYPPDKLFVNPSPTLTEIAQNWESSIAYSVTDTTKLVIDYQHQDSQPDVVSPDTRAAAYFLRGWAHTLPDLSGNTDLPAAVADIEQAAKLKPDDRFFADSLAYLREKAKK